MWQLGDHIGAGVSSASPPPLHRIGSFVHLYLEDEGEIIRDAHGGIIPIKYVLTTDISIGGSLNGEAWYDIYDALFAHRMCVEPRKIADEW